MTLPHTPGQTVGPFFHYALPFAGGADLVPPGRPGALQLHGRVLDGNGDAVPDAIIEIWQTSHDGVVVQQPGSFHRDGWTFTGWGRCATDGAGHYSFTTCAPGATDPGRAPFFAVAVLARGLTNRLFTRAYLPRDPALVEDPFLGSLEAHRRDTLVATADDTGFVFDIRLQGERETVFLSYSARPAAD